MKTWDFLIIELQINVHLITYWAFSEAGRCIQQLLEATLSTHNKGARQRNIYLSDAILLVDKLMSIANNDVKGKHTSVHSGTCDIFVKFGNLTGGIFFRQIKDEIQTHKVSGDSSLYRSEKRTISN